MNCSPRKKTIVIEIDLLITVGISYTNFAPFWSSFDFLESQELLNFQILEKWQTIKFVISKKYMVPSLEFSIVVWLRYIALKLFWRIWESNVKEKPPFNTFLQMFHKNFKILASSYNISHFVPIFKKIDKKIAQV